jgi:hypothetical protein
MQAGAAVAAMVQRQYTDYQAAAVGANLICFNWFGACVCTRLFPAWVRLARFPAERRHPTDRERMDSPALQTLQDPPPSMAGHIPAPTPLTLLRPLS